MNEPKSERISIYKDEQVLASLLKNIRESDRIDDETKRILVEYDQSLIKRQVSFRRRSTVLNHLKMVAYWVAKPLNALTKEDLDKLRIGLFGNTIKTKKGAPYSEQTKGDAVKMMRAFARWMFKKEHYKIEGSFDTVYGGNSDEDAFVYRTKLDKTEPRIITLDEIKLLSENAPNLEIKTFWMLEFDAGGSPEEMFNVRLKHVNWDDERKCYTIQIPYPKKSRKARTVDVPMASDVLKLWLATCKDKKPDDLLFDTSYNYARMKISKISRQILGRRITLYDLRHSSIQLYTELYAGNKTLLDKRYGWSFASKMLETYLARTAVGLPDTTGRLSELAHKTKFEDMQKSRSVLEQQLEAMRAEIAEMRNIVKAIETERAFFGDNPATFMRRAKNAKRTVKRWVNDGAQGALINSAAKTDYVQTANPS